MKKIRNNGEATEKGKFLCVVDGNKKLQRFLIKLKYISIM
jgi:hypothetical protein